MSKRRKAPSSTSAQAQPAATGARRHVREQRCALARDETAGVTLKAGPRRVRGQRGGNAGGGVSRGRDEHEQQVETHDGPEPASILNHSGHYGRW